jgi:hypothetical protein
VHQKFNYTNPVTELPDYARQALATPENEIGLYERADGTSVIYLVLASRTTTSQEVRQVAAAQLGLVKQQGFLFEVEKQLIQSSDVHILFDNLPSAARTALATWSLADYGLPVSLFPQGD